ncbi:endogenous retrovirus group K member 13-1 Env polyprotein-like isoform X1 [Callithrix jacchus]|uniref:endogenous retrovirus group K member 18 Env polyprotein-like n=1 Tax=Callithrix jacchus TaxID=9483 RepID=UPI0023DD4E0A|nr:endogenous retrovirus group K member 18 Env polyprotein-like [Callithrix jacchus]XP_054112756.1 endogenous retrovirus group K member 18 Env polyprotein-like [Callithrix jacchus]XP_054112757.1 endogenous retrovirus group K member 18 Env polyprotein-like [Callithrix jacchus]XP_054112758.1 endogenous retrovirus group K member 18 Env polyprotein-like [Callithrix jacchus]XP_054112759.1 endogenous retrovirus group K member 18 Env polyprotein-like [Callithrix jacchus]XP_054112760.1 endogenous retr
MCFPNQKQTLRYTLPTGFILYDWSIPHPLGTYLTRYEMPGGWSTPIFTTKTGKAYTSLWKLFLALTPGFVRASSRSSSYPSKHDIHVQACIASPYAIIAGNVSFTECKGHYSTFCNNCILTNCLDSPLFPLPTILIIHQPPYVMLPVNISGSWYDERGLQILHQVRDLMVRSKRFISIFIASILAIVSVVATAAVAAAGLAHSVQTAAYVNYLAKNISVSMGAQLDIDKKLDEKLNALEQTVNILGDKIYNIQNHMALHCHVDYNYICVTNAPYSDSAWQWPLVKAHLQGIWSHDNLSLDVFKLQQEIHAVDFSRKELLDVLLWQKI